MGFYNRPYLKGRIKPEAKHEGEGNRKGGITGRKKVQSGGGPSETNPKTGRDCGDGYRTDWGRHSQSHRQKPQEEKRMLNWGKGQHKSNLKKSPVGGRREGWASQTGGRREGWTSTVRWMRERYVTCFVDNIPNDKGADWLRPLFSMCGEIKDVFVPRVTNRRKSCWKFGFIRYETLKEAEWAAKRWNNMNVGGTNLYVKVQIGKRWSQTSSEAGKKIWMEKKNKPQREDVKNGKVWVAKKDQLKQSGKESQTQIEKEMGEEPIMCLKSCPDLSTKLKRCSFGRLKHPVSFKKLRDGLEGDGVQFSKLCYMGGIKLLIVFESEELRDLELAQKSKQLEKWFDWIKPWHKGMIFKERTAQIAVQGLPHDSWSDENLIEIAVRYGKFIKIKDDSIALNNTERARVLVETEIMDLINESFIIKLDEDFVKIHIWEECCYMMEDELEQSSMSQDEEFSSGAEGISQSQLKEDGADLDMEMEDESKHGKGAKNLDNCNTLNCCSKSRREHAMKVKVESHIGELKALLGEQMAVGTDPKPNKDEEIHWEGESENLDSLAVQKNDVNLKRMQSKVKKAKKEHFAAEKTYSPVKREKGNKKRNLVQEEEEYAVAAPTTDPGVNSGECRASRIRKQAESTVRLMDLINCGFQEPREDTVERLIKSKEQKDQ